MIFDPLFILGQIVWWLLGLWWLWLFAVLAYGALCVWMAYIQEYFKRVTTPRVLLELKIPREIKNTPRAMEQIFATLHSIKNSASDVQEKYWDGEMPMWFSLEAVSFGGEIHFYLYVPVIRRNHIEAAFYANYPDIEITEVPAEQDYIHRLPSTAGELYEKGYRLFGAELRFGKSGTARPQVYPIRTYLDFEATVEEKEVDPVGQLIETLSRLKPQEHLWVQLLVRPKVDNFMTEFHKLGQDEINTIRETGRFVRDPGGKPILDPESGFPMYSIPSPGQVDAMKAIDRKISKPAFDCVYRYMYMAPKEIFNGSFGRRTGYTIGGQYASESLNKFSPNVQAWTLSKIWYRPYIFPTSRAVARRAWLWEKYRARDMYPDSKTEAVLKMKLFHWGFKSWKFSNLVLNTEELATLYHMPTILTLTGPLIKRVEARRGGPPAGLPIYGEEGEEQLPLE